jgi:electron transport complex protein RnfD
MLFVILYKYIANNLNTPLTNLSNLSYIDTFNNIVKPYGSIIDYTLGLTPYYLSPILSICSFIYLFNKKSIKYNILLTYMLTFSFIMLTIGMLNNMNIWYLFFQLTTGNILFLMVFSLGDYPITPITTEGQVIYGIILGLITGILRFIIPELSVILPLILGPILLTKTLNNISYKLKYNHKYYYTIITTCILITIIATTIINIIL